MNSLMICSGPLIRCKLGEGEYLFAPYSVFTVKDVKWSDDPREEHRITIAAAIDNAHESDDLPLAPW